MESMTAVDELSQTAPEVVTAFFAVALAYEKLWVTVEQHPADARFTSEMLGFLHAASVIPRMAKL